MCMVVDGFSMCSLFVHQVLFLVLAASQYFMLCQQCVEVQVFSIRAAATDNLAKLAQEFGPDWAQEHLVPQVGSPYLYPVDFVITLHRDAYVS